MLYERALKLVPGSYKLWHAYLKDRVARVSSKPITDPAYQVVNNTFERALVFMNKMPRIWLEYCEFLMTQRKATVTRRVFDRALQVHCVCSAARHVLGVLQSLGAVVRHRSLPRLPRLH